MLRIQRRELSFWLDNRSQNISDATVEIQGQVEGSDDPDIGDLQITSTIFMPKVQSELF